MTDFNKALVWAKAWNDIVCSSAPGPEINVMDVLTACTTISIAYLDALPPAQREQASKLFLANLQLALYPPAGSLQ